MSTSNVAPGPPGIEPRSHLQQLVRDLIEALRDLLAFTPVFFYFWLYWNLKEKARRLFHIGALSFLSLSLIILVLEITLEFSDKEALLELLHESPTLEPLLIGLFIVAILFVLLHHHKERRHAQTEYRLTEQIWLFLVSRGSRPEEEFIAFALSLVEEAFSRLSVIRVCIWQENGEELTVRPGYVHPTPDKAKFLAILSKREGVASLVFADKRPRYVPRVYFPFNSLPLRFLSWSFPHAWRFEIAPGPGGRLDVIEPKIDQRAVTKPELGFSSFVAVPMIDLRGTCTGVLCIDFKKTDPLDRIEIKMASLLGILIADELQRIRSVSASG